jgi:hypothetical protein
MIHHFQKSIDIHAFRLAWRSGIESTVQARFHLEKGPDFFLDMSWRPEGIQAKRLEIQDEASRAFLTFRLQDNILHASFSGSISERTLESIYPDHRFQDGSMSGDFEVDVPLDKPFDAKVRGNLAVKDFSMPWRFEEALEIDSLFVEADGRLARLDNAHVRWGGKPLHLDGKIEFQSETARLDLEVRADSLRVEEILASAAKLGETPKQDSIKSQGKSSFPLRGTVRVKSEILDYGDYRWTPFDGAILFEEDSMVFTISEATLCGIPTTGAVTVTPGHFDLRFDAQTKNKELLPALTCLVMNGFKADGTFDLKADISARGKAENLISELSGSIAFSAEKGRIYHSFLLVKVFAFLNLTEILFGKLPDFSNEGFAYDALMIRGQFQKGTLHVTEAILDGDTMELGFEGQVDLAGGKVDGRLLVAPLRTVDRIVRHIPLLGRITGGKLVSIPIQVTGDLKDPRLTPLSPSAIGQGLINAMRRTFNLPVDIIDSFRPDASQ